MSDTNSAMLQTGLMTVEERQSANQQIFALLYNTIQDASKEVASLRRKLAVTYWVIIILSIIMFFVGITLLSIPAFMAFRGEGDMAQSLIIGGLGIADLAALFLFRPTHKIHQLMGDIGQITLAINSYQTAVGLRLLESDMDKRDTIGRAARYVSEAARESIELIQRYFEPRSGDEPGKAATNSGETGGGEELAREVGA